MQGPRQLRYVNISLQKQIYLVTGKTINRYQHITHRTYEPTKNDEGSRD